MIKFNGLNLKDLKITDALASVVNGKKIAVGSEVIWEKSTSPLPSGYRQVEYLQGTGTQYIDTDFTPDNNTRTICDCICTYETMFGARIKANGNAYSFLLAGNTYYRSDYYGDQKSFYDVERNQRMLVDKNKNITTITIQGTTYTVTHTNVTFTAPFTMTIFALKQTAGIAIGQGTVYSFQIYDNDTLVRDFITCLDNNDRPCMFDLVTQQPFYNQGTGEFLYGNII